MLWVKKAKEYLQYFSAKDLDSLAEFYAPRVEYLCDSRLVMEKNEVLKLQKKLFDQLNHIHIKIYNTCYNDKYICIECVLQYDYVDKRPLKIIYGVYIIQFNDYGNINSIKLYTIGEKHGKSKN